MQAIGRQPQQAPDGAPVHCERHRPEQTTLYRLVQQHTSTFIAQAEDAAGAELPQLVGSPAGSFHEPRVLGVRPTICRSQPSPELNVQRNQPRYRGGQG